MEERVKELEHTVEALTTAVESIALALEKVLGLAENQSKVNKEFRLFAEAVLNAFGHEKGLS